MLVNADAEGNKPPSKRHVSDDMHKLVSRTAVVGGSEASVKTYSTQSLAERRMSYNQDARAHIRNYHGIK